MVSAVARLTLFAVDHRVVVVGHVARGVPHLRVHHDGGVDADHVLAFGDEAPPPPLLNGILQFHAERTVTPAVPEAAVNLRTREHKAPALTERNDLVEGSSRHCVDFEAMEALKQASIHEIDIIYNKLYFATNVAMCNADLSQRGNGGEPCPHEVFLRSSRNLNEWMTDSCS